MTAGSCWGTANQQLSGQSPSARPLPSSRSATEHFEGSGLHLSPAALLEQLVDAAAAALPEFSSRDLSVFLSSYARALDDFKNVEPSLNFFCQTPGTPDASPAAERHNSVVHGFRKPAPEAASSDATDRTRQFVPPLCAAHSVTGVSVFPAPSSSPPPGRTALARAGNEGTSRSASMPTSSCTPSSRQPQRDVGAFSLYCRSDPCDLGIVRAFRRLEGRGALATALLAALPQATARDLRALANALPRIWAFRDHLEKMKSLRERVVADSRQTGVPPRYWDEAGDKKKGIKEGRGSDAKRGEDRMLATRRQQEQAIVHAVLRGIRDRAQELHARELAALALDVVRLVPFDGEGRGGEEGGFRVQQALTAVCQELYRAMSDWKKKKAGCKEQAEGGNNPELCLNGQVNCMARRAVG